MLTLFIDENLHRLLQTDQSSQFLLSLLAKEVCLLVKEDILYISTWLKVYKSQQRINSIPKPYFILLMIFSGNVDYLRNSKVYLKIKRHDIYDSTLKSVRSLSKTDWLKLFVIKFEAKNNKTRIDNTKLTYLDI